MKFRVTFKDPDVLHDAVQEAVQEEVKALPGMDEEEREALVELRVERTRKKVSKWFEYDEYVTIECDTDADTATVVAKGD